MIYNVEIGDMVQKPFEKTSPGVRLAKSKTLLFESLTGTFPIQKFTSKENCLSSAWWIPALDAEITACSWISKAISKSCFTEVILSIKQYLFPTDNPFITKLGQSIKFCELAMGPVLPRQIHEIFVKVILYSCFF